MRQQLQPSPDVAGWLLARLSTPQLYVAETVDGSSKQSTTATTGSGRQTTGPGSDSDDEETPEDDDSELPLDQVFEILKNKRRRETLHYLRNNDGEATLSDLAEHIAALENDTTVRAISSSQRKRVYVGLYQCHLPKMDDMDVIDFDQNRGTIEVAANMDQLTEYLSEPASRDWYKLYLGITAAGVTLFAASQLGAAQFGLTPSVVLLTLVVGIAGCAVGHAGLLDSLLPTRE